MSTVKGASNRPWKWKVQNRKNTPEVKQGRKQQGRVFLTSVMIKSYRMKDLV